MVLHETEFVNADEAVGMRPCGWTGWELTASRYIEGSHFEVWVLQRSGHHVARLDGPDPDVRPKVVACGFVPVAKGGCSDASALVEDFEPQHLARSQADR
jgi:hypothetical protein